MISDTNGINVLLFKLIAEIFYFFGSFLGVSQMEYKSVNFYFLLPKIIYLNTIKNVETIK
jgi:hypothetical protein